MSKARVSFRKGEAYVTYDPEKVAIEDMISAISRQGFRATKLKGS